MFSEGKDKDHEEKLEKDASYLMKDEESRKWICILCRKVDVHLENAGMSTSSSWKSSIGEENKKEVEAPLGAEKLPTQQRRGGGEGRGVEQGNFIH